jgi:hypothetical protein
MVYFLARRLEISFPDYRHQALEGGHISANLASQSYSVWSAHGVRFKEDREKLRWRMADVDMHAPSPNRLTDSCSEGWPAKWLGALWYGPTPRLLAYNR